MQKENLRCTESLHRFNTLSFVEEIFPTHTIGSSDDELLICESLFALQKGRNLCIVSFMDASPC